MVKDLISLGVGAITDLAHFIRWGLSAGAVNLLGSVRTATVASLTPTYTVTPLAPDYAAAILATPDLAVWWRLGEASGTQAVDASGHGRHGTYAGGAALGQPGALVGDLDTAVLFNGTSSYVLASLNLTGSALTVEAWVTGDGSWGVASDAIWFLQADDDHHASLWLLAGAPAMAIGDRFALSSTVLAATGWHHVVGTWTSGEVVRLYVDGVLVAQSDEPVSATPTWALSSVATNPYDNYFGGRIDEAAVYLRQLSADEIAAHYALGRSANAYTTERI